MCFNCNTNGHYANMCPLKRGGCGAGVAAAGAVSAVPVSIVAPQHSGLAAPKAILEEKIEKYIGPKQTLKKVNLRKMHILPFSELDLNLAIRECA